MHFLTDTALVRALARTLPFAAFIALLAARDLAEALPLPAFDERWLYLLQAGAAAVLLLVFLRRYTELAQVPRQVSLAAVSVLLGLAIFVLWINATAPWMRLGEPAASFVPLDDGALRWDLIAVRLFGAVLVVPLMEELFWRSFVMRRLDRADFLALPPGEVSLFAIVASSVVFALAHDLWLAGFIAGLLFAWLYRLSGNIWYPILAHAVANLALGIWVIDQKAWSFW
jgi:uncharacterized protein